MTDFLRELGYSPARYWLLAGITFILWITSALLPWKSTGSLFSRINRPAVYGLLLLAVMFAWRWPAMFFYKPVNPDESQFLASGITMLSRGSIWWTDTMTSGPLVVLPLLLPALIGFPVNFTSGRVVGLLENWGLVYLVYLTLRHLYGDRNARLLVTPLASFVIFLLFWDFVPYCSERSPLFLCAGSIWLSFTAFRSDGTVCSRARLAAAGFVIGLLPFSKFQVMPMGAAIGISLFCWVVRQPGLDRKTIWRDLLYLLGGLAAGIGLVLISIWQSGEWSNVYESYLVHNLHYTRSRGLSWTESAYILSYLTDISWGFYSFHVCGLLLLAISQWGLRRTGWRPLLLGWSLLVASYAAVLVPGRLYPHYLLFLTLPLTLLIGLQFGVSLENASRRSRISLLVLFLGLGTATQLIDRVWDRRSLHNLIAVPKDRDQVAAFINREKKAGDSLAIWGWRPELYVETQLPQGIRESLTEAQLNPNSQRGYFRARLLADLQETRPAFFVDSVGPEDYLLRNRGLQSHEVMPELKDYIARQYAPVEVTPSFRVYVRRDRWTELK